MLNGQYISSVILNKAINADSYLLSLPVVQYLMKNRALPITHDVTFLVGENGTGKSTLLEAIAVAFGFNAEGRTRNFNFSTNKSHSELFEYLTLAKSKYAKNGFFLRTESFYNAASYKFGMGSVFYDEKHVFIYLSRFLVDERVICVLLSLHGAMEELCISIWYGSISAVYRCDVGFCCQSPAVSISIKPPIQNH